MCASLLLSRYTHKTHNPTCPTQKTHRFIPLQENKSKTAIKTETDKAATLS